MIGSKNGTGVLEVDFTSNNVCIAPQPTLSAVKKLDPLQSFSAPQNAEQLAMCLLDVEVAKKLLASKLPLSELRSMMVGCYMCYHAIREVLKDSDSNFFIDKIIHVNRDGIRFKHCRDNSYRSIHKIKAPENPIDHRAFDLWTGDMKKWNEPLPFMDLQLLMLDSIKKAIVSLPEEEALASLDSGDKIVAYKPETPCEISSKDLTKLVITVEEMIKLIDYGRDIFDRTVTGFYTQIRAPPNPNVQKEKKTNETTTIFMDQIIGVSWATKPYMMFQRPMTIVLKFRHFRDERMCQLPYWSKVDGMSSEVYSQWLNDMHQWDEEYPTLSFIEQKAKELATVLSKAPSGPPIDVIKVATIEAERENSTKLLKKLKEWQEEQDDGHAFFRPFPPLHPFFYPPMRPSQFPHWPMNHEAPRPRPLPMYGRATPYQPYSYRFHGTMAAQMHTPPMGYSASPFGFYAYPQHMPSNHTAGFHPKAPKHHPPGTNSASNHKTYNTSSSKSNASVKEYPSARGRPNNRHSNQYPYHTRNDYSFFEAPSFQTGYKGNTWF